VPLTEADKSRVRQMRAQGYKVATLAYLFGCHRQTIAAACRPAKVQGVQVQSKGAGAKGDSRA
jgi:IS30 family transposase